MINKLFLNHPSLIHRLILSPRSIHLLSRAFFFFCKLGRTTSSSSCPIHITLIGVGNWTGDFASKSAFTEHPIIVYPRPRGPLSCFWFFLNRPFFNHSPTLSIRGKHLLSSDFDFQGLKKDHNSPIPYFEQIFPSMKLWFSIMLKFIGPHKVEQHGPSLFFFIKRD